MRSGWGCLRSNEVKYLRNRWLRLLDKFRQRPHRRQDKDSALYGSHIALSVQVINLIAKIDFPQDTLDIANQIRLSFEKATRVFAANFDQT